jgi:hypothetical protein
MAKKKKSLKRHVAHAAGWQVAKRVAKMVPFGGTAVAVVLVGTDIKNKGLVKGVINSGIDAIPVVGLVKNGIEIVRGKDFLPDKEEKKNGSKA